MNSEITGVILCGGRSSRMKTDKALLKLGERTIIEIILDKLKSIFKEIIISSNESHKYEFLNVRIINDIYTNRGPLAGIHSALTYSNQEKIFVSACDIPLVPKEMIDFLINYQSNCQVILPKFQGRVQFLCGIYSKSINDIIEHILNSPTKKGALYELAENVSTEIIDIDELEFVSPDIFLNLNTTDDFDRIKRIFNTL